MLERNAKTLNVSTPILAGVCEANSKLKTASGSFEQIGQEGTPNKRTRTGECVIGTNAEWRRPNKSPSFRKTLQAARAIGQSGNYTPLLTNRVNYLTA